jgi:membrane-associated phospholipid phosphatase
LLFLNYCTTTNNAWWKKALLILPALAFSVGISYTRLFLGVHSINQTLFGILLGLWCAFTLEFCIRVKLEKSVKDLIECKAKNLWKYWVGISGAFVAVMLSEIL